jgi:endonuclease YncB( thermonuclease family)
MHKDKPSTFSFMRIFQFAALLLIFCSSLSADEWQTLKNCRLVENESNDGDSFHVIHEGEEYLFRLYHVDTPESETDSTVAERVQVQAEYFGISVEESLRGGKKAKEFTKKALSKPFVVVTRFQKAMGRSKLQRYYAVILADGGKSDLAEMLIRAGLARAYGQVVDAPKGKSMADYKRFEKQAKSQKMGLYGGNTPTKTQVSESRLPTPEIQPNAEQVEEPVTTPVDTVTESITDSLIDSINTGF